MNEIEELLSALMEKSGLTLDEINRKLEEKRVDLGHLINDDVAVRLVAKDLGVQLFNNSAPRPTVFIEDLVTNMNNINLILTAEAVGTIKEFPKKTGGSGKIAKVLVSDPSGKTSLVLWDEKTELAKRIRPGSKIGIFLGYTRSGLEGEVELHIGNRGRVEILEEGAPQPPQKNDQILSGRIFRVYDPIEFKRKDGSDGKAIAFLLVDNERIKKVLVWDPSEEFINSLIKGQALDIIGGVTRKGLNGAPELHINDERLIRLNREDIIPITEKITRLAEIQPEMSDITVEGIVETDFNIETTYSGKSLTKVLLKDNDTVIPVVFWNDKAIMIKRVAKTGSRIRVEGCYSKVGPHGLEIGVNRWSKIYTE